MMTSTDEQRRDRLVTSTEALEAWDWETARPTGKPVSRSESYAHGIPHEGVHLWILRTLPRPELLFQMRAMTKDLYPGCLDITVGGHVPFGMTGGKIQKESLEEIGFAPADADLIDLGYHRYEERDPRYFHREFQHVYLLERNAPLSSYAFTDGEVSGIYAVPLAEFEELLGADREIIAEGYDGTGLITRRLTRKDFHPLLFAPSMEQYIAVLRQAIREYRTTGTVLARMRRD